MWRSTVLSLPLQLVFSGYVRVKQKFTGAWTNFSLMDKTCAEFSTLEVAAFVLYTSAAMKKNCQT